MFNDNDDAITLYDSEPEPVNCAVCDTSLDHLTIQEREEHYQIHFDGETDDIQEVPTPFVDQKASGHQVQSLLRLIRRKGPPPRSENIFWHTMKTSDPPRNFTPCLIPLLRRSLLESHSRGNTQNAMLCHEGICHVGTEPFDIGWGCAYRNFLMACTVLVVQTVQPLYFALLDIPSPCSDDQNFTGPGVSALQYWIEDAWKKGFDSEGAAQLKNKLVGTKSWIGTADLYIVLASIGIPARLVDFPKPRTSMDPSSADLLCEWVISYFSDTNANTKNNRSIDALQRVMDAAGTAITVTTKPPVILQHKGHSRTIVGYEIDKEGRTNLLIMDPARRPSGQLRDAALAHHKSNNQQTTSPNTASSRSKSESPNISRYFSPSSHEGTLTQPRHTSDKKSPSNRNPKGQAKPPTPKNLQDRPNPKKRIREDSIELIKDVIIIKDDDYDDVVMIQPSKTSAVRRTRGGAGGFASSSGNGTPKWISKANFKGKEKDKSNGSSDTLPNTVRFFRTNLNRLNKNDEYQVLFFPLEEPLTDAQKEGRKVVSSELFTSSRPVR